MDESPVPTPLPLGQVDAVIHERMRLAILSTLAAFPSLTFTELKTRLGMTDGNLSVHARRLEEVGYIEARKSVERRVSRTDYRLTPGGRRALERYLGHLEALIAAVRSHLPPR